MQKKTGKTGTGKRRKTKDRVVQARIPEQLDDELRDRAEQLGLSVSTIVRNVLSNTFDLVEGVVTDSANIANALKNKQAATSPVPEPADDADAGIIGWQEAVLNQNGVCETCNAILQTGQQAAIGIPVQARPRLLCLDCLVALSTGDDEASTGDDEASTGDDEASTGEDSGT